MKTAKKTLAILLAVVMVMALGATAFAVDSGKGGPASITIDNAKLGSTYTVYKLFDATVSSDGSKIAYKLPSGKSATDITGDTNANTWFTVDDAGNVTAKSALTAGVKTDAFKTWATGFGASQWSGTAADEGSSANMTGGKLVIENLPYGYYVITTTTGAGAVTVDSTKPNATVNDKNTKPDWPPEDGGKTIKEGGNKVKANAAKLEDPVEFEIAVDSQNLDDGKIIVQYDIEDVLDAGWTYTEAPTVTVGGTPVTVTPSWFQDANLQTAGTMINARGFRLSISWTSDGTTNGTFKYTNGARIVVTYKAKLAAAKLQDNDTTNDPKLNGDPNKNEATFKWFSAPKGDTPPTTPNGIINTPSVTRTYSTEIEITKKDNSDNILTGAEFTLTGPQGALTYTKGTRFVVDDTNGTYWKLKDGTYTDTNPNGANINQNAYESTQIKYRLESFTEVQGAGQTNTAMKGFVGADGKVSFSGLVPGTYTLSESVVPSGYNKHENISFTLSLNTKETLGAGETRWTVSNVTPAGTTIGVGDKLAVTVVNNQGVEMPETGGVGTTIFYILGSCLLLGAAVLLITRKRMSKEG